MKIRLLIAAASAVVLSIPSLLASVTILEAGYSSTTYHTHSVSTSSIVSFDWDPSDTVYYQTSTASFSFGGLYSWDGSTQSTAFPGSADFSGNTVVRSGNHLYFNTSDFSDQKISKYGPLGGSPSTSMISTAANWGVFSRNPGELFITGAPGFGTNEIFRVTLDGSGNFDGPPVSLGVTIGSSGPIAFDLSGNMYYAPGFGDRRIYKYTAADVAAAIADPVLSPLPPAVDRLWYDYSVDFSLVGGGTGMAIDANGDLLLTLTSFSDPSYLVRFDVDLSGAYQNHTAILSSTDRMGDVRFRDGSIYLGNSNTILQVIPEPSVFLLSLIGGLGVWALRRRRA